MAPTAVVIPSFDDLPVLRRCLTALLSDGLPILPIVVDHGVHGLDADDLEEFSPDIIVTRASQELWWAGATNVGINYALSSRIRNIVLLNSDCVIRGEAIRRLTEQSVEVNGIVAPMQRDLGTAEVVAGRAYTAVSLGFPTLWVSRRAPRGESLVSTQMIIGGRGVVIPARVFESVGLFAENALPHYLADHDFFLRAKRAGEKLYIAPTVDVFVDADRTSRSATRTVLTTAQVRATLHDQRSHYHAKTQKAFFQRNYPIRPLWRVGLTLSILRFAVTRLFARRTS